MEHDMNKNLTLIINDANADSKTISRMIQAFCTPDILKSCGGYIFTYRKNKGKVYLGVKPSIIEGQRSNHFDLKAGPETKVFLTGGINTKGEISLLFKLPEKDLNETIKSELRELYIQFTFLLIKNSYKGHGKFEWITKKILEETNLFFPIPLTIFDLNINTNGET
jgi:hypothetical protein